MKPCLQVINKGKNLGVECRWVERDEVKGTQKFSHPDCEIWLVGRDNDTIGYNVMIALQAVHMPVKALRRIRNV